MTDHQIPQSTLDEQFGASDPTTSAWVAANAGSGKTHVLTQRVIRLLLAGNQPDRILCLTFTKAAAANMKNRVFDTLAGWTMLEDIELAREIKKTSGKLPSPNSMRRARQLFAEALDTPGGLKIQTIHAFCESLLHQFPLEANVSGHFEVLQDTAQVALLEEAQARVLAGKGGIDVGQAMAALVPHASDQAIQDAISEIIAKRHGFRAWLENAGGVERAANGLYEHLDLQPDATKEMFVADCLNAVSTHEHYLTEVRDLAIALGGSNNTKLANWLFDYFASEDDQTKFEALQNLTLTDKGLIRSSIGDKHLKDPMPETVERIQDCGLKVLDALEKIKGLKLLQNSHQLFIIADAVLDTYERLKRSRSLIDYDDQIERSVNLLQRMDIGPWIRYRLDSGIDHVLVDEAQDTSPAQWKIINAITDDFHVGEGASMQTRTEFVVGDEKQSIYSFQGADPKEFAKQERALRSRVKRAGKKFKPASLALSFRSTPDVLGAVDVVFEDETTRMGLTQDGSQPTHDAVRNADPGEVQIWPLFAAEARPEPENWLDPVDREGDADPAVQLAEKISSTIKDWVGKPLPGTGEPLKFGDILVLVRKRDRFITALTRTMKDQGLGVAGADRLRLMEHIAVEDLVAVGRFVLLPEDDLNLACVLKSIFFDLTDEDLFVLSHDRSSASLYEEILRIADDETHEHFQIAHRASHWLNKVRDQGSQLDVFDFYAWLLGVGQGRKIILKRLGMEAEDVVDAFMDEVLTFVREGGLGLEGFIAQLTKANPEIKRELEMDRDEVRILTVHSSKGLEARVVFLVDPCNPPWRSQNRAKVVQLPQDTEEDMAPYLWVPTTDDMVSQTTVAMAGEEKAAEEEYRRLLYVGMTRAADRLVVCGYRGKKPLKFDHWHEMVSRGLVPGSEELLNQEGEIEAYRWTADRKVPAKGKQPKEEDQSYPIANELPEWLFQPAKSDPPLPRPLTPSGAYALIDRDMKSERKPAFEVSEPIQGVGIEMGNLIHALLEHLPDVEADARQELTRNYIERHGRNWTPVQRNKAIEMVDKVLNHPDFEFLFDTDSRSEVPVIGRLETKSGVRLISGQIDRLVVGETSVTIVDYKTNRIVPRSVNEVAPEYITQLALYRHIVSEIFPDKKIVCSLLWTSAPTLMALPQSILDDALALVKNG